jgi:hypothetical protein
MHTLRFGRKLALSSTIAIKHQVRKLMAADQVKKELAEAGARSTDIPPMNAGPRQPATQPPTYGQPFAAILASAPSSTGAGENRPPGLD